MVLVQNSLQNSSRDVPEYLSIDPKKSEGELLNYPELDQVSHPLTINLPVVCDFFSSHHLNLFF